MNILTLGANYTKKIASMILERHVDATTIIIVNDPYDHAESIKDDERESRIQGQDNIPNVFMKSDNQFPSAREFKTILCKRWQQEASPDPNQVSTL